MTNGYEVVQRENGFWYVQRSTEWRKGEVYAGPYATKERAERVVPTAAA